VSDLATIDSQFINFIDNSVTNTETLLNDDSISSTESTDIELPDVIRMCNLDNNTDKVSSVYLFHSVMYYVFKNLFKVSIESVTLLM